MTGWLNKLKVNTELQMGADVSEGCWLGLDGRKGTSIVSNTDARFLLQFGSDYVRKARRGEKWFV